MIEIILDDSHWSLAEERAKATPVYDNSHRKHAANQVGCLGEVVTEAWLQSQGIDFQVELQTTHDYRLKNNQTIDVKTKDRTVKPIPRYDCSVPLYNHEHQRPDYYIFVSLYRQKGAGNDDIKRFKRAYLLGYVTQMSMNEKGKLWKEGEVDPDNNTRFWTDCINVKISDLEELSSVTQLWRVSTADISTLKENTSHGSMCNSLADYEKSWKKSLKESRISFLGEISLEKTLFVELCGELGERIVKYDRINKSYGLSLTVLAVNCAYFDYDAEFWAHLFDRLGIVDEPRLHDAIGQLIEGTLDQYKVPRRKREGSFRYVGCLLEQCGITRKSIKHFSRVFEQLIESHGYEGLQVLSYGQLKSKIPDYGLPGYLSKFLCDKAGWQFLQGVARNLSQYRRNILTFNDLRSLNGYHPSFWAELIPLLGEQDSQSTSRTSIPVPKLFLDFTYKKLVVRFEREYLQQRRYSINGETVVSPSLTVGEKLSYACEYEVRIKLDGRKDTTAVVDGWDPRDPETPIAFFDPAGSFLKAVNRGGSYILLAPFGKNDIPESIIEGNRGLFNFKKIGPYQAFNIKLKTIADIEWANLSKIDEIKRVENLITFDGDGSTLEGACDYLEVFVSKLPRVKIESPDRFTSGEYLLLFDDGAGPQKLNVAEGQEYIDLNEIITAPAKGDVWIERVYRSISEDSLEKLSFALLPEGTYIRWPNGVYQFEDCPLIDANIPVGKLNFKNATQKSNGQKGAWTVNDGVRIVEGSLVLPEFQISLAKQIRRLSLVVLHDNDADILFRSELDSGVKIHVSGAPRLPVIVSAQTNRGEIYNLGQLGVFTDAGEYIFSTHAIRDAYSNVESSTSELSLFLNGNNMPTKTWIVDPDSFVADLNECLEKEDSSTIPSRFVVSNLVDFIDQIIANKPLDSFLYSEVPLFLKEWVAGCLLCANLLDGANIDGYNLDELRSVAKGAFAALRWFQNASVGNLDMELPEWTPPLPRWRDKFSLYISLVGDEEVYVEWSAEIKSHRRSSYGSRIAKLDMGRELCDAWWRYWKRLSFSQVYIAAERSLSSEHELVRSLAKLLVEICLVRTGRKQRPDIGGITIMVPFNSLPLHDEDLDYFA